MKMLNEFIFESMERAKEVYDKTYDLLKEKGYVSCCDLYSIIGSKMTYPDIYYKHGWTNMIEATITYTSTTDNKWVLKMPEIQNIENKIKMKEGE